MLGASATRQLRVLNYKYGYFSVLAFLVPFLRWLVTLRFRKKLLRTIQDGPWDRIDLVGHSFGTHILAWGFYGIKRELRPQVHTVILAGSVLRSDFPWDDLVGKHIARVVNDCGARDKILLLSQFFVLFTGMAGRIGFGGMTGDRLRNRFFAFGHSGYFLRHGKPDDSFMQKYWLPMIAGDANVPLVDDRKDSAFSGLVAFLANNAEPIKLAIYITPLLLGMWGIYGLYVEAEEQRQEALSRALALESREADDYELAIRLSLEALRVRDTLEARRSLVHAASSARGLKGFSYLGLAADAVSAIAFSEDGERVFSGDAKGIVRQWYVATEESLALGAPLDGKVLHIGVTDGGKRLVAIAARQASLFDFDIEGKPKQETIDLPFSEISSAILSKDGSRLAVGDRTGRIAVLDRRVDTWSTPFLDTRLQKQVTSLAFHPNGSLLGASYGIAPVPGREHPIVLWDVLTGKRLEPSFVGHSSEVMSLDFSPDGKQLVSGSWDQDVRLWDTTTGRTIPPVLVKAAQETDGRIDTGPTRVAISPDGEVLASVNGSTAALWTMANHKRLAQFSGLVHGTTLAFDRKGKLLAVGGDDRNIVLIPIDFAYWLKRACGMALLELTADERRYYLGESRERGAFAAWLWETYWSIRSFSAEARYQRKGTGDPCADMNR